MRRIALTVLASAALAATLAGCGNTSWNSDDDSPGIAAQGSGGSRSYAATGFTDVSLASPDQLDVRVGPAFSVRAEGSSDVLDVLRVRRDGDSLVIDRRAGVHLSGQPAHVTVTLPVLREATLAGSGAMTVDRVAGDRFRVNAAGSGTVRVGALATRRTDINLAGSSGVTAAGSAGELHVSIAGSGSVTSPQLTASRANVSIAGSGDVRAAVNGDASVQIMGSGDVNLGPQAHCSVTRLGSGNVTCGSNASGSGADDGNRDAPDNGSGDE